MEILSNLLRATLSLWFEQIFVSNEILHRIPIYFISWKYLGNPFFFFWHFVIIHLCISLYSIFNLIFIQNHYSSRRQCSPKCTTTLIVTSFQPGINPRAISAVSSKTWKNNSVASGSRPRGSLLPRLSSRLRSLVNVDSFSSEDASLFTTRLFRHV